MEDIDDIKRINDLSKQAKSLHNEIAWLNKMCGFSNIDEADPSVVNPFTN